MSSDNIDKTYDWAKKQRTEWDDMAKDHPMVSAFDTEISGGGDHAINPAIAFAKFKSDSFTAEVGKNEDGDLIFHFWPTANDTYNHLEFVGQPGEERSPTKHLWVHNEGFSDSLADAFLEIFKLEDRLCWDYVPEMNSWVVRAAGFGENIMADELSSRLFINLRTQLEN